MSIADLPTRPSTEGATATTHRLSLAAREAWRHSCLSAMPPALADTLLAEAHETQIDAGGSVYRVRNEPEPALGVVISGLLRVYSTSPEGRQATLQYVSAGGVYGVPVLVAPAQFGHRGELAIQAIADSRVLILPVGLFTSMLAREPLLAHIVHQNLVETLLDSYELLAAGIFMPVRSRVGRHLLNMAQREDGRIIAHVSQQNIADAIGSVREVVSRAMLRLRDQGLIARAADGYEIVDPAALHRAIAIEI